MRAAVRAIVRPASVAVVGTSAGTIGSRCPQPARAAVRRRRARRQTSEAARRPQDGSTAYASVLDVPGDVEVAFIADPADSRRRRAPMRQRRGSRAGGNLVGSAKQAPEDDTSLEVCRFR